jgi:hypothetical protein
MTDVIIARVNAAPIQIASGAARRTLARLKVNTVVSLDRAAG